MGIQNAFLKITKGGGEIMRHEVPCPNKQNIRARSLHKLYIYPILYQPLVVIFLVIWYDKNTQENNTIMELLWH